MGVEMVSDHRGGISRRTSRRLVAMLLILESLALLPGRTRPAAGAEPQVSRFLSDFRNLPPGVYRPDLSRAEIQQSLSRRHPGFQRFLAEFPGKWQAEWNESAGTPHRLYGDSFPLQLAGDRLPAGEGDLAVAARLFIASHQDLIPVRPEDLVLDSTKDLGAFTLLRFGQLHGGVPVLGTRVEFWVAPGARAILVGVDALPERCLAGCAAPGRLDAGGAEEHARSHASRAGLAFRSQQTDPVIAPLYLGRRIVPRLAWRVQTHMAGPAGKWTYLVSAGGASAEDVAGELLGRWDEASRGTVSGSVRGKGSPGVLPDAAWNPPEFEPLPNLEIEAGGRSTLTAADGTFSLTYSGSGAVSVSALLRGPYCQVVNDSGTNLSFSNTVASGTQLSVDFNSSPSEFATAQVNAYLAVNRAHDLAKSLDPTFTAIDRPIPTHVNASEESCNAYFIPGGTGLLSFFRSNPCVNSAYSTVVYHEYAHYLVWKAFGSVNPMPGYNEGVADAYSALLSDQPHIGDAFNGIQGAAPIRDLSRPPLSYPGDLLLEPHFSGLIIGGAFWDLRLRLGETLGSPAGLDLARRLHLKSLFLAPTILSPDITLDLLALDDDDGVLANSTPHFDAIVSAFSRHGLAPPGQLSISHEPLGDSISPGPFLVKATVSSNFDFMVPTTVTLRYSTDGGGSFKAVNLPASGGKEFQAEIPAQPAGTTLLYYLVADGTGGARSVFPPGAPQEETLAFAVGETIRIFSDNFDGQDTGWTHGIVANGNAQNRDEWQRGTPRTGVSDPNDNVDGNLLDPPSAFSPPNCWGNDLGLGGLSDRNYSDASWSFLQSPAVDCTGKFGVHLRFRRWLTVERFDRARILVNEVPVYQSPGDRDTLDTGWRAMDYDLSGLADDRREVRIRFELQTGLDDNAGGWNVDDLALVATGDSLGRPTLTVVEPAFDFKGGGASFTLRGSGFTSVADTALSFGATAVTEFRVADAETITGTVPLSATPGPVMISLQNSGGGAALSGKFTYFDLPTLQSVIPPRGQLAGGDSVSVRGEYYTESSEVLIGGKSIGPLTLVGHELLLGVLPPGDDIGPAEVVIRSSYGESRFPDAFAYVETPILTGVEPASAPVSGGIEFILRGNFFPDDPSTVAIDFGEKRVSDFSVVGRTEVRGVLPAADQEGAVDVR
ncbi:MAG TPA: IPT/TIG domain-containing protein, partial [Candidatus Polarisedimenticolia bacterium]|nr:IPT/TIG domain-containing protein [Candidatus Polarisedimenticolia bacterium]